MALSLTKYVSLANSAKYKETYRKLDIVVPVLLPLVLFYYLPRKAAHGSSPRMGEVFLPDKANV